jgi:Zn-dependent protease
MLHEKVDLASIILVGFYILILVYTIIAHEVAHGFVALWLGDLTAKYSDRLNFNPIKHVDPIGSIVVPLVMLVTSQFRYAFGWAKPVPYNPYNLRNQKWGPALVALGGPGSNIAIALLAVIIAKLLPVMTSFKKDIIVSFLNVVYGDGNFSDRWFSLAHVMQGSIAKIIFGLLVIVIFWNVILAFFNLIPFPPLDGSKLLFAIIPVRPEVMMMFEQYGFMLLLVFIFLFSTPIQLFLFFMLKLFLGLTV